MLRNLYIKSLFVAASTLVLTVNANAAIYNVPLTMDLNNYTSSSNNYYLQDIILDAALPALSVGDIIDTTLSFMPGQTMTITETDPLALNPEQAFQIYYFDTTGGASGSISTTGTMEFSSLNGDALLTPNPVATTGTCYTCVFSQAKEDFTDSSFTFSGIRSIIEITDVSTSYAPGKLRFYAYTSQSAEIGISSVPLPPALYLFGSGLMGLIIISKRKKTA